MSKWRPGYDSREGFDHPEWFLQNARNIIELLKGEWTINAICGMLGTIMYESQLNPWRKEEQEPGHEWNPDEQTGGGGLFAFTPFRRMMDYAESMGGDPWDGNLQVTLMLSEVETSWYPQAYPFYNISYEDFKTSTMDSDYLAMVWLYDYEHGNMAVVQPTEETRKEYARKFALWVASDYKIWEGEPSPPTSAGGLAWLWAYLERERRR